MGPVMTSADAREGALAFAEKRAPGLDREVAPPCRCRSPTTTRRWPRSRAPSSRVSARPRGRCWTRPTSRCPRSGRRSPGWAGSGCTSPRSTAARARACPSWPWCWRSWAGWSRPGRSCPPCSRRRSSSRRARVSCKRRCCRASPTGRGSARSGSRASSPDGRVHRRPRARRRARGRPAARRRRRRAGQRAVHGRPSDDRVLDPTRRAATVTVTAEGSTRIPAPRRSRGGSPAPWPPPRPRGRRLRRLEMAVAYVKQREQFGRTVGTFQAVKHHCANLLLDAELATAAAWDAQRATAGTPAADLAAAVAAARAVPAGRARGGDGHPAARRHRLHLGARLPPLPAPGRHTRRVRGPRGRRGGGHGPARARRRGPHARSRPARGGRAVPGRGAGVRRHPRRPGRRRPAARALSSPATSCRTGRRRGAATRPPPSSSSSSRSCAASSVPSLGITGWNIQTISQHGTPGAGRALGRARPCAARSRGASCSPSPGPGRTPPRSPPAGCGSTAGGG